MSFTMENTGLAESSTGWAFGYYRCISKTDFSESSVLSGNEPRCGDAPDRLVGWWEPRRLGAPGRRSSGGPAPPVWESASRI